MKWFFFLLVLLVAIASASRKNAYGSTNDEIEEAYQGGEQSPPVGEIQPKPCTQELCRTCFGVSFQLILKIYVVFMGLYTLIQNLYNSFSSAPKPECLCNCSFPS